MGVRRRLGHRSRAGQRHAAHDQALQAGVAGIVVGKIGVIVALVAVAGMDTGIAMRRQAEIKAREIEGRRDRQQQDQAKAKPLPQ